MHTRGRRSLAGSRQAGDRLAERNTLITVEPAAAVVVSVRNARSTVVDQLEVLLAESRAHALEVVVVDDASTDATAALVTAWIRANDAPGFRLVRRSRRGGPNAARNDGVSASRADFLLFCDGDDVITPGWVSAMLAARAADVILCGALEDHTPSGTPTQWPLPPSAWGVPYAYGGNMATTRAVIDRVGGFDEGILAGGTEFELCFRAGRDHGVSIVGVEDARIRYRSPTGAPQSFLWQIRRERGRCYLRRKFGPEVVPGRTPIAWAREWSGVARLVATRPRDDASRRLAATRLGSLVGRFWWSIRFRVFYL